MRKSIGVLLIFILIGGMLGGIFGEILRVMAPNGTIQNIFASNFPPESIHRSPSIWSSSN